MRTVAHVARRLASIDAEEAKFRAAEQTRRVAERLSYLAGRARWRTRGFDRLLDEGVTPETIVRAAREGRDEAAHERLREHLLTRPDRFVLPPLARERVRAAIYDRFPRAAADAAARADAIVSGRYDLLGYTGVSFTRDGSPGDGPPDWHFDPVHQRRAPMCLWSNVPYLDPAIGDHKIIWELNRHQHWLTLGRAAWLTGNPRYRQRALAELTDWTASNPPLTGINWASMLELAFRSLSWIWMLHFFAADENEDEPRPRIPWLIHLLAGLTRQLEHVRGHLSRYFSPNTHYTGEALALYIAGRVLPELRASASWRRVGREILMDQIAHQIGRDGGHVERSAHYHRYTLDFYLLALAVARLTHDSAQACFADAALRLARFARTLADDKGRLPQLGDDDGGSLTPVCRRDPRDVRDSLALAAVLLSRPELAVDGVPEEVYWLAAFMPTTEIADHVRAIDTRTPWSPKSAAFDETGYYVSRGRNGDHLILDAGPHAFLNGGHAHADALSVTLTVRGAPLFVDPGTASYTIDPELRDRFRSAAMHNTVIADGTPPCEPAGPFHWRSRADGRLHAWRSNHHFDFIDASHTGYDAIVHRRLVFAAPGRCWIFADHLIGEGRHEAVAHWHVEPSWEIDQVRPAVLRATHLTGGVVWIAAPRAGVDLVRGETGAAIGWQSPVYGVMVPATAIRLRTAGHSPVTLVTAVVAQNERDPGTPAIDLLPVWSEAGTTRAHVAVRSEHGGVTAITLFVIPADTPRGGMERPTWRVAGLETDARMLHYECAADGSTLGAAMVDGTFVRRTGGDHFGLELPPGTPDASVRIGGGIAVASSSCPLGGICASTDRGLLAVETATIEQEDAEPGGRHGASDEGVAAGT
jgi:heparinase II/III-like protein